MKNKITNQKLKEASSAERDGAGICNIKNHDPELEVENSDHEDDRG